MSDYTIPAVVTLVLALYGALHAAVTIADRVWEVYDRHRRLRQEVRWMEEREGEWTAEIRRLAARVAELEAKEASK